MQDYEYLLSSLDKIKGIGNKTLQLFLRKKINTIFDLIWHLPISNIETSQASTIKDLQIGKVQSIKLYVLKYNFPRIRNLPSKVNCLSSGEKIDCVFFNSYEGYIKKILPINKDIIVYGKIGYYNGKYQITNPKVVSETAEGIFKDIKKVISATRYHSLIIDRKKLSKDLIVTAETQDKIIMGIMHKKYDVHGVQFHPESIKTPVGMKILKNFLKNQIK